MKTKIVTNCKDCVFNTTGRDDTPYCKLDEDNRDLITTDPNGYYVGNEIPEWCPIRCGGILISQPKEVEPQTEITSAELWQNRYESLLKGLNDLTNELNVYKVNKDFDLDELKESYIELCKTYNASSVIKIWNFFLPHLQKPVESDAVEFLEWIGNDWTKLKNGWMKSDLYTTIEATHTTAELYEQFKQLNKQD